MLQDFFLGQVMTGVDVMLALAREFRCPVDFFPSAARHV